ncbi:hypothetical protein LSAJ156_310001 [Latilactobacillus sakei]|nr:hypothetical protein LSAJ156_310001 [Latilactobacillus sakei]
MIALGFLISVRINYRICQEQKKIGIFFQKLDHGITLQQSKVDKLKNLKQAYLQKLFP